MDVITYFMSGEDNPSVGKKNSDASPDETPQSIDISESGSHGESGQETASQDIDQLKKDLQSARKEIENLKDKWLRAEAELDNYRKRVQKEKYENFLYGHEKIVGALLPVLDNLERAIDHGKDMGLDEKILEGVELTYKQFLDVFEKNGIVPLSALGKEFDPNMHEAIMEEESREHKPRTIIKEIERGYMLRDRLLRPSKVILAKAGPSSTMKETAGGGAGEDKDKGADNGK